MGRVMVVNPRFLRTITHELLPILFRWASVPRFVRVLRLDLASEARSSWWKVSQYSPEVLRRVLLFLLNIMLIKKDLILQCQYQFT